MSNANNGWLTAAIKIREYESTKPHQSVIIAVTANILLDDAKKCEENGMSDYLTKPFQQQQLVQILKKWIRKMADAKQFSE